MDQLNLDGLSLGDLLTLDSGLAGAITARLQGSGADAADSYSIEGRTLHRASLTELVELRANVANAIAKKAQEPDGIGIALAEFNDA